MNFKYLFLLLFNIVFTTSCLAKGEGNITLEGKWKVIDCTYSSFVGRGLDKDEIEGMSQSFIDLIFDFGINQIFTSNKPNDLSFLENKKFSVNRFNEITIGNHAYFYLTKNDKVFLFFNNIILQIEKVENYTGSKIILKEIPADNSHVSEVLNRKEKNYKKVYLIEELDIPPKFEGIQFDDNCLIDCLYTSFNKTMMYYIDYSKLDNDVSFFITFVINKTGKICNFKIKSRHNKPNPKGIRFAKVRYGVKKKPESIKKIEYSEIEKSIVSSILYFNNNLISGMKNNLSVNTKLSLELRLISK